MSQVRAILRQAIESLKSLDIQVEFYEQQLAAAQIALNEARYERDKWKLLAEQRGAALTRLGVEAPLDQHLSPETIPSLEVVHGRARITSP